MATTRTDVRSIPYGRAVPTPATKLTFQRRLARDLRRNRYIYVMLVPVVGYYLIFHYGPMYGAIIAFKEFSPGQGILGSPWVGLQNFEEFFSGGFLLRL